MTLGFEGLSILVDRPDLQDTGLKYFTVSSLKDLFNVSTITASLMSKKVILYSTVAFVKYLYFIIAKWPWFYDIFFISLILSICTTHMYLRL